MTGSKADYIAYRVAKSEEVLADAALLVKNKRWNSAVNRLYYSSFYLVTALLYQKSIKAETHNGVKTQFLQHFIKTGLVSKEFGKLYANLFNWRQETYYVDFLEFDGITVEPLLKSVVELNKIIQELLSN